MKFCGNCGSQQPDDAVTCENCGSPLSVAPQPTQEQPQRQTQQSYSQQPQQIYVQGQMPVGKIPSNPSDKKKAIAAMVLGIIGTVFSSPFLATTIVIPIITLVVSIIGVALAIQARNAIPINGDGRGFATAGLVCSIIGIVGGGLGVSCVLCACAPGCAICAEGSSAANKSYWDSLYYTIIYVSSLIN